MSLLGCLPRDPCALPHCAGHPLPSPKLQGAPPTPRREWAGPCTSDGPLQKPRPGPCSACRLKGPPQQGTQGQWGWGCRVMWGCRVGWGHPPYHRHLGLPNSPGTDDSFRQALRAVGIQLPELGVRGTPGPFPRLREPPVKSKYTSPAGAQVAGHNQPTSHTSTLRPQRLGGAPRLGSGRTAQAGGLESQPHSLPVPVPSQ